MNLIKYKALIKNSVWNVFFKELQEIKLTHIKVKHIEYENSRKPQKYLTSGKLDNKQTSLLFNLRCRSTNEFRDNQHNLYGKEPLCLLCKNTLILKKIHRVARVLQKSLTLQKKNCFTLSSILICLEGRKSSFK